MDLTAMGTDYARELSENALSKMKASELTGRDLSKADDEELMEACKKFEEYFTEQIFKTALKSASALSGDKGGSLYMDTMKDYYQDEYSKAIATSASESGQIGLARELFEQMKRSQGVSLEEALQKNAASSEEPSEGSGEEGGGEALQDEAVSMS